MSKFIALTKEEQNDMIIQFLKSQEIDQFLNELNLSRFVKLYDMLPDSDFREKIKQSITATENSIIEVGAIIKCTIGQLPTKKEILESLKRINKKI